MTFFLEILDFSSKKSITVLKIRIQVFLPKSARKFILSFYLFSYKRKAEKWWFVKPCGSMSGIYWKSNFGGTTAPSV